MKHRSILALFMACVFTGCMKDEDQYKDLLGNREIIYPGLVSNLKAYQGNLRIRLQWNPSPDPSITKYMIYWNNNADSMTLKTTGSNTQDSVSAVISGVAEYVQNFTLYTFDGDGNRSIGQSLSGVRIYGPLYVSSLTNRIVDAARPPVLEAPGTYKVYFSPADTLLNVATSLSYTDAMQQLRTARIDAKTDSVILEQVPAGAKVALRSTYVPVPRAIDTFAVAYSDTLTLE
jgi:hypothetical protein